MTDRTDSPSSPPPAPASPTAPASTPAPERSSRRTRLGLGIAAAALGVIALTAGVTAVAVDAFDDDDDDDRSSLVADSSGDRGVGADGSGASERGDDDASTSASTASGGSTADVEQFESARDAALDAADGEQLLELERTRDGWSAEVLRADGTDVDVALTEALEATVGTPDTDDDRREQGSFADDGIARAIEAALAETGGGEAHEIALTDDDGAYEISVRGEVRAEITLDASYAVVEVDLD
ncbi:hypothetical protein [Microcella flavibacter]|uniref:hypothetical protein n=1 Tax=Microcella flavibacter TaxID=1804990 RepID=UPI00145638CC|nr:hypothetical protein [Microcella flavibacter]